MGSFWGFFIIVQLFIMVALIVWLTFFTCRLHANAVHGLIAESGPPLSIHIQVHTWFVTARFIFSPAGKLQMPVVNIFKVTTGLKMRQIVFYATF